MKVLIFIFAVFIFSCASKGIDYYGKCPKEIKGYASYYSKKYHGRRTASGERFNMYAYTAAHRYLPFGTVLIVENLKNERKVKVRINDRGPFIKGRVLDVSYSAAKKLGMLRDGVVPIIAHVIRCGK